MIESRYLEDNIENIKNLMSIPSLKYFETKSVGKLLKLSKIREYADGEVIIQEGDQDPWMYILLSGKIRIPPTLTSFALSDFPAPRPPLMAGTAPFPQL